MPYDSKTQSDIDDDRILRRNWLDMPVIGMEAEFNIWLDGVEIVPEDYWKHPSAFIDEPLLTRTKKSSQLPTGGAVYFDRGVIEVVTPVIEIATGCSARVVRNLWEQIGFVRDSLTKWERKHGHTVRMKAYSSHFNVSFELPRRVRNRQRNIQKLALLLAYILPVPVMVASANRRSTGVGVRPRVDRIEITVDFTPDPGLMIATAALLVGMIREVISWPSYDLSLLDKLPIPVVADVVPGKHTTRRGWLTKDFHYPERSPFTSDINAAIWKTRDGRTMSLRQMANETACFFKKSIRKYADPFSFRLLFAILEGRAPSMLELVDRPIAYEDVGRLCRWGMVIHELQSYTTEMKLIPVRAALYSGGSIDEHIAQRLAEREKFLAESGKSAVAAPIVPRRVVSRAVNLSSAPSAPRPRPEESDRKYPAVPLLPARPQSRPRTPARSARPRGSELARRSTDSPGRTLPARKTEYIDRRTTTLEPKGPAERRREDRRRAKHAVPFPDRRLTRSAYEQVFLKLVSGNRLKMGREVYTPVGMKGWYHAIFKRESDGAERLLTIDQLLKKMNDWQA